VNPDEQQAALAAREAELAGWKEEAERSHRNVAYWRERAEQAEAQAADIEVKLLAAEEDLKELEEARDYWTREFGDADERADKAEAELATLRAHVGIFDCTAHDTSDFVRHCPRETPCARHRAEQAEAALAAREAELAEAKRERDAAVVEMGRRIEDRHKAEAELATLRGALEEARSAWNEYIDADTFIVNRARNGWYPESEYSAARERRHIAAARLAGLCRTPEGDDALDDAARNLFAALCEGDGKHSEALDRRIIASHLDAYARRTTPPRRPPEPECDSCGERHLPQVMCPPHEVRRGTRNTMAVKPQGDDT
jgi:hypothetical protein